MSLLQIVSFSLLSLTLLAQEQKSSAAAEAGPFHISGTVVDSLGGQPLANTRVAIAPVTKRDAFRVMMTAEDGRFSFDGVSKGKYTLTAQRKGYITQSFNQHEQYSTSIVVGPELISQDLVFRLRPQGSILGKITDEQNEAVRNAEVMLFQANGDLPTVNMLNRAMSNDQGVYHFNHLSPGKYFIVAHADPWYAQQFAVNHNLGRMRMLRNSAGGQNAATDSPPPEPEQRSPLDVAYPVTYYPSATDASGASVIAIAPGERFTADVTLQPVPAVHAKLTVASPDSTEHFSATLKQQVFGDVSAPLRTGAREISPGVLEISGVAPGHYTADINSYGDNKKSNTSSRELDMTENGEVIASQSAARAMVSGLLKLDNGGELPGRGLLQLRNKKTRQTLSQQTSTKGEFEFKPGLPPATYDVFVANLGDTVVRSLTATGARVSGLTLQISGAAPVTLTVVVTEGIGKVEGTALKDDKPLAGAMIVLVPDDAAHNAALFRRDQSDSDGTFNLSSVLPGRYRVLALENGWDLDRTRPEVYQPYLAQGTVVQVAPKGKYDVKVKVQ